MTTTPVQKSALPWEITETIIDHLYSDVVTLSTCSSVCSAWLIRCRHHMFYRVQLWPWRVQRFLELANEKGCTFTNHVRHVEMDDAKVKTYEQKLPFKEAISQLHPPCFVGVQSIQIRNVDWTSFSIHEQGVLRGHLSKFVKLSRLEFRGVVFHDLRELVRIVDSFSGLQHLTAYVSFKKYFEHTLVSAHTLGFSRNLRSIELGTEDSIPVVLSCIVGREGHGYLQVLDLQNIKPDHHQYVKRVLKKSGKHIQDLTLGFANEKLPLASHGTSQSSLSLCKPYYDYRRACKHDRPVVSQ